MRVPHVLMAAIAGAWALAIAVEVSGNAQSLHHDAFVESGLVGLVLSVAVWQAMTAAMMLPSSLPLVRLFTHASAGQPRPRAAMAAFLGGYALVWTGFAVLAFLGDAGVHRAIAASSWLQGVDWAIGGAVLALAGAFQFTALKESCLRQCRQPGAFLLRYYERGPAGGFRLGARHGLFCVGCCWALMLVMFAVGVANLIWMAILTALMVHEKTRPLGARTVPVTGVVLLSAASVVLLYSAYSVGALAAGSSFETGKYTAGNTKTGAGVRMHIGANRFSVQVIRYREECKYGDRTYKHYFTFRSGTQAKLTGKVKTNGDFSGRYVSSAGEVKVSGHVDGRKARVKSTESGPYNPASTVRPNRCEGSRTFRAVLTDG